MGCWSRSDRWRQTWGDGGGHTHSSAPLGAPRFVPPRFYAARALWGESISPHPPLQSETGSHMISVDLWIIILDSFLLISWCLRLSVTINLFPTQTLSFMKCLQFSSFLIIVELQNQNQNYIHVFRNIVTWLANSNILMLQNTFTCTSFSISHDFIP